MNTRNSWKTRLRISFSLSTAERLIEDFDTLFILWFPVVLLRGIFQWARVAYVCHYAGERKMKTKKKRKKKEGSIFFHCPCLIPFPLWLICIYGVFGSFIITNVIRLTICAMCCGSYFLFRMIFLGPI